MTDCIEYEGRKNHAGYGHLGRTIDGVRKTFLAHRYFWEKEHGPIPDGMFVCHHCDNPPCINIDHLFLGTPKDNMRDMIQKALQAPSGSNS